MKRYLYPLTLIALSLNCSGKSVESLYRALAKKTGFAGMSYIEIAARRNDYKAIRHFDNQSSQQDLIKAREIMRIKLEDINQDLKTTGKNMRLAGDTVGAAQKTEAKEQMKQKTENILFRLNSRIK